MSTQEIKPRHRPVLIALAVLGAAICLLLAYWQFSRWESASGSGLNFGYALQWPVFGAFLFFLYQRFISLEAERDAQRAREDADAAGEPLADLDDDEDDDDPAPVTEIPADILPTRRPTVHEVDTDDDVIAAYNRYLEALDHDAGDRTRTAGEG